MEAGKAFQALLYQTMVATVLALVEDGEMDEGRAVNWVDVHTTNIVEDEGKYRVEIVKLEEEEEDADGS